MTILEGKKRVKLHSLVPESRPRANRDQWALESWGHPSSSRSQPPATCWSHWECEHQGNFSQWKDFFIASVLQTPPGLLIMNLGSLTSKCVT